MGGEGGGGDYRSARSSPDPQVSLKSREPTAEARQQGDGKATGPGWVQSVGQRTVGPAHAAARDCGRVFKRPSKGERLQ